MRGFFGGVISGLLVLAAVAVVLSILVPALPRPDVGAAPSPARGTEAEASGTAVTAPGSDADLVELAPSAPSGEGAAGDDLAALSDADTEPAGKPQVAGQTGSIAFPAETQSEVEVGVAADAPVASAVATDAPGVPVGDTQPSVATQPAQPATPPLAQEESGFGAGANAGDTTPDVSATVDQIPETGSAPAAPLPGTEPVPAPVTQPAEQPPETGDDTAQDAQTGTAPTPEMDEAPPPEPQAPAAEPAGDDAGSRLAALPQAGTDATGDGPRIGRRVVPLTERDNVVAAEPAQTGETAADGPPIEVYAADFENPEGKPLMAIVLIDDDTSLGAEALADFPYPVTIAINPLTADAAQKMARHRAAGHEVVALIDLPKAATAQDAEVALSVWLETLPQVVAVFEGTGTGFQGNRALADQVTAIAKAAGLGVVLQDNGLNTAHKMAVRNGVPAGLVFRDFDGAGQKPDVMRRFLDQAAFRAGTQGGVIMLGRVRPDTISALTLWGLQDRAGRIALAPLSAVLKAGQER